MADIRAGHARPLSGPSVDQNLFEALLLARKRFGRSTPILEDPERNPLTYDRLVLGSLVLGRKIAAMTGPRETVGVLLPSVNAVAVVLFGLAAFGRRAAFLNFTAGVRNLTAAARTADLKLVLTSRRFVEQAKLDEVVDALRGVERPDGSRVEVRYVEDVRKGITTLDKVLGVLGTRLPRLLTGTKLAKPHEAAVTLFTSGSEATPKGVVLSHRNLVANVRQIMAHGGEHVLRPKRDVVFNPLPVFHSYGLTAGMLVGVLSGMKVVLYPSPLHYRQVPKLIGETKATILFATDTFLQGYGRAAEPGDLASVRLVITGAEKVKADTRRMWSAFGEAEARAGGEGGATAEGVVILEGYGATECSPVIACNDPETNRPGSVGRLLPGQEWRLEPVEGIAEGGRLAVRGPNVMNGYLLADRPGEVMPPAEGWHDTGDIVTVDEGGFVTILGRAKRFAKIGGEMVSLAAVETMISQLWPGRTHVVVALPDARKGEQLVLVTEQPDADRERLTRYAREQGFSELWAPRSIFVTGSIPVLGSGKVDVAATVELARQMRPLL